MLTTKYKKIKIGKVHIALLLGSVLLSGCEDSEKSARSLMNQAIKQWDAGQLEKADRLFQKIENDYLDTAAATEAIKERQARRQKYKEKINLSQVKRLNNGVFSKQIIQGLETYHQKHQQYPDALQSLDLFNNVKLKPFFVGCDYKKALFDMGYSLNCIEADSELEKQQRQQRRLEREAERNKPKKLTIFPKAKKTFAELMNLEGALPSSGFFAYYFRMSEPNKVVFREKVKDIAINYAGYDFHGIDSRDFGGYWVGEINFDRPTVQNVSVDLSWSSARIMIDKRIIYDGKNNSRTIPVAFSAGKHLVEVEYSNGWHTTEFAVSFTDKKKMLSSGDIKKYFRENKMLLGDFDVFYAGAYESDNKDLTLPLNILPNKKPIVLVLSSYSMVKWVINNPHRVEIKVILLGSYDTGTEVRGVDKSTKLLYAKGQIGGYQLNVKCECRPDGDFHCSAGSIQNYISRLMGHKLNGFSGKYDAKAFDIPDKVLNDQLRDTLELEDEKIKKQRQACTKKYNPNFENILHEYQ